jgi:hypothetical protein
MENQDVVDKFVEIEFLDSDAFLKVKETLTRMGIASRKPGEKPVLWQSCHVLHKRGHYFVVHFKQMFLLDGRADRTVMSEDDTNRLNAIVSLLNEWGLVKPLKPVVKPASEDVSVVVISYASKGGWSLKSKYSIGRK